MSFENVLWDVERCTQFTNGSSIQITGNIIIGIRIGLGEIVNNFFLE